MTLNSKQRLSARVVLLAAMLICAGGHAFVFGQNTYQVSRSWGASTGDWADIGSFANTGISQYVVFTVQGHWCGSIISAQFRYDDIAYTGSSTNWMELPPSNGGKVYNATQPVAIDIKRSNPGSTSDPILARIRNLQAMCGGTSLNISIESNTTFTGTTNTGSSGTVDSGYAASDLGWKFPVTTDDHAASTNGLFILNTGNIGIGTITPNSGSKLDVRGGVSINQTQGSSQRGAGLDVGWTGGGNADVYLGDYTNGWAIGENPDASMRIFKTSGATLSSTPITIQAGGNVGIGTTSPSATLHLKESGTNPVAKIEYSNATTQALQFANTNSGGKAWSIGDGIGTTPGTFGIYDLTDGTLAWAIDSSGVQTVGSLHALGSGNFFTGNVGIGTTSPVGKFDVSDGTTHLYLTPRSVASGNFNQGTDVASWGHTLNLAGGLADGNTASGVNINFYNGAVWQRAFQIKNGTSSNLLLMPDQGNVGIGQPNPAYKLDVNGTINSSSTITGNNIVAKYQDVAEWVPSSEQLAAGTVVVLDATKANQVTSSSTAYDTRVAGVVSEQPGISLGEKSDGKVLVATTGRVRVQVDATKSPIHIGDLLVTSDIPGVAMKSEPVNLGGVQFHRPGTLIGKALEPLEKGKGSILVLLSLQ